MNIYGGMYHQLLDMGGCEPYTALCMKQQENVNHIEYITYIHTCI